MEAAFQEAAGYSAEQVAFLIRAMIAALYTLWMGWVIYNQYKLVRTQQLDLGQWVFNSITTVIIGTIVLVLVGT